MSHRPFMPGLAQAFAFLAADARLCLALTLLYSLAVWRAGLLALCLGLAAGGLFFLVKSPPARVFSKRFRRILFFSLAWPLLKLAVDIAFALPFFQTASPGPASAAFWRPALLGFALLFLRLLVLCGISLALLQTNSPRSLGLGLAWLLRPVAGRHTWKISLGLAFMAQYLLFIPQAFAQARLGAQSRKLSGFAPGKKNLTPAGLKAGIQEYSCLAGQFFKSLSLRAEAQATAAVLRKLDSPTAWEKKFPRRPSALVAAFAAALPALFILTNNLN